MDESNEMTTEEKFFEVKKPWSKIKDQIISKYLVPYLSKVKELKKPIIIIDAFAGPGVLEREVRGVTFNNL